MTDSIHYGTLMHNAMRGLVRTVLSDVQKDGLPGEHHFFISFYTQYDGVEIAEWMIEDYPEEMTIVIQNWFDELDVSDAEFSIILNFNNAPEKMTIPFDAITAFVDPSVEFGMQFEPEMDDIGADLPSTETIQPLALKEDPERALEDVLSPTEKKDTPKQDAEIVSLDKFRK
ncbi:MAG: SspB family protein [Halocynthiibacter sp.]